MVFGIASLEITNKENTRQIVADVIENSATPREESHQLLYKYLQSIDSTYTHLEPNVSQIQGVFGWSSGGCVPLIHTESGTYVAMFYNESEPTVYSDSFTYPSGNSASWAELSELRMLSLRNTVENLLINTEDEWLVPSSDSEILSESHIRQIMTKRIAKAQASFDSAPDSISEDTFSVTSQPLGSDTIKVDYDNMVRNINGKLIVDTENNIVSLMDLAHINLSDYKLNELSFCDGTLRNGELQDRSIHLVKLRDVNDVIEGYINSMRVYQSNTVKGRNSTFDESKTPVLTQATKQLIADMSPTQNL